MKKLLLVASMAVAGAVSAQAPIEKGETQFNAAVGTSDNAIPINLGLEFGMGNNISVGFEGTFRRIVTETTYIKYTNNAITPAVFANYHFNEVFKMASKWDLYGGLSLGYTIYNQKATYTGPNPDSKYAQDYLELYNKTKTSTNGIDLGGQIGGRYFFTENFALNVQGNFGNTFSGGKVGITYKF